MHGPVTGARRPASGAFRAVHEPRRGHAESGHGLEHRQELPTRRARLTRRVLTGALIATTLGLFGATGMLYVAQSEQRQLLATSIRTSGWIAYQAQLEYAKAIDALDEAEADPSSRKIEDVGRRLDILASRIRLLYGSDEGQMLSGIEEFAPALRQYEGELEAYLQQIAGFDFADSRRETVETWREELAPLGHDLQKILETSVVYNDEIYQRERELARNPAAVPLALMFLCGAALVSLLGIQAGHDRRRLNDVLIARREQAATESNFRSAIEAMPVAVVIFDPVADNLSFVNPAARNLLDASSSEDDLKRLAKAALDASKAAVPGPARAVDIAFSLPGGTIMSLRGSVCDIAWEGRRQRLLALADVSKIRDAELQVMQAAKLATLGEMATAIAHETNQPLAVIKMAVANAKRLIAAGAPGDAVAEKLTRIGDQVDRVKRITDQVRRYGRPASQLQEPFPLQNAIGLAIGFVAEQYRAAGIGLEINLDLAPELLVAGEQTMFEQVIVNILVNAHDAFEAPERRRNSPNVTVRAHVEGGNVVIGVDDNAGGIRPDMLGRIFDPFATTKARGKGTGLGLSMSRNIIRDMNGDIQAANFGLGARLTITLPVAKAVAHPEAARVAA